MRNAVGHGMELYVLDDAVYCLVSDLKRQAIGVWGENDFSEFDLVGEKVDLFLAPVQYAGNT